MSVHRENVRVLAPADGAQARSKRAPVVAIVGGGFAGTLTAVNLLRRGGGPLAVVLVERSGRFGPGIAYSTEDRQHLLNVPAENMSALCEEPEHFREWAREELGERAPAAYVPRHSYGTYVSSLLAEAERHAPAGRRLRRIAAEAVDIRRTEPHLELILSGGLSLRCDRVVLALGHPGAAQIEGLPADPRVVTDPWAATRLSRRRNRALAGLHGRHAVDESEDLTLIVGTGLTAVDTILSLSAEPTAGPILAISRSGQLPFGHLPGLPHQAPAPALPSTTTPLDELERIVREHVRAVQGRGLGWREAIDGLRPVTQQLWGLLSWADRKRFLEERAREWEVRRHRMAPPVHRRLRWLREEGRLTVLPARLLAARASRDKLFVSLARGPAGEPLELSCARIVVCAGATTDVRSSANPLLRKLFATGTVSADELGLGLRTSPAGAVLDARGNCERRIFTLGPLRRGELWETTAVGEIRQQARELAVELEDSLTRAVGRPAETLLAPADEAVA